MAKEKLGRAALEQRIREELREPGCTITVNSDPSLGWHAVAFYRTFDGGALQMRVEQIAQILRSSYDLDETIK